MDITGWEVLRIVCGLYFLPHTFSKTFSRGPHHDEIAGFFEKAGLRPASLMVPLAVAIEVIAMAGLVTGFQGRWAAWLAAAYLGVASIADVRVAGFRWSWVEQGCEYPVFWGFVCAVVAANI